MAWVVLQASGLDYTLTLADGVTDGGTTFAGVDALNTGTGQLLAVQFNGTPDPINIRWIMTAYSEDLASGDFIAAGVVAIGSDNFDNETAIPPDSFMVSGSSTITDSMGGDGITSLTSSTYLGDGPQFPTVQFTLTIEVEVTSSSNCDEIGRASKAIVSAYNRTRVQRVSLIGNETRCLLADFNGAIPRARTIASVTFAMNAGGWINMSDAKISSNRRASSVLISTMWNSRTFIRCSATFDNGEIYTQLFDVRVNGVPWFQNDSFSFNGSYVLSAT